MLPASEYSLARLKIDLDELIILENRYFRLMVIGSNHQFLTHLSRPIRADDGSSLETRLCNHVNLTPASSRHETHRVFTLTAGGDSLD